MIEWLISIKSVRFSRGTAMKRPGPIFRDGSVFHGGGTVRKSVFFYDSFHQFPGGERGRGQSRKESLLTEPTAAWEFGAIRDVRGVLRLP